MLANIGEKHRITAIPTDVYLFFADNEQFKNKNFCFCAKNKCDGFYFQIKLMLIALNKWCRRGPVNVQTRSYAKRRGAKEKKIGIKYITQYSMRLHRIYFRCVRREMEWWAQNEHTVRVSSRWKHYRGMPAGWDIAFYFITRH